MDEVRFSKSEVGHIYNDIEEDTKVGHLVTAVCGDMSAYKGKDHESPAMCTDCVLAVMLRMLELKNENDMYRQLMFPLEVDGGGEGT